MEYRLLGVQYELAEARRGLAAPGTDEEIQQELGVMTRDAQQSGQEVRPLRMPLADALTFAVRAAPMAPQALEDRGKKYFDSVDC